MKLDVTGRTALVTGASRGIGRAIADALVAAGARVAIHAAPEHAAEAEGGLLADLAEPGAAQDLAVRAVALLGQVDMLILNAAVQVQKAWADLTDVEVAFQLDVNIRANLALLQALVPPMQARSWGRVLAIGSIQEARPHPGMLLYAASKSAQVSIIRNLARQVAADGVTANVLSPGVIETQRNAGALADAAYRAKVMGAVPARRFGTPADCAGAALLLLSDAGSYITGAVLPVDGGMGAGGAS